MPMPVVAVITAKPGSAEIVGAALNSLVEPTRAEEGCIAYDLYVSDAENTFVTIEQWRGPDDLTAHMGTDHIKAAFASAGEHMAGAPAIHSLRPYEA